MVDDFPVCLCRCGLFLHVSSPAGIGNVHMSEQFANEARKIGVRGACAKSDIGCVVEAVETLLQNGTYHQS
jgi:hypothetical protein